MRFESQDFIKSQRQWRESRESKTNANNDHGHARVNSGRNSRARKAVSNDARARMGSSRTTRLNNNYEHRDYYLPKRNAVSDDDARDDEDDSDEIEREQNNSTTIPNENANNQSTTVPPDFSRKELEQLVRSKQKQKRMLQEAAAAAVAAEEKTAKTKISSYEEYTEGIRRASVEAFLNAHDKVKKSNNREAGAATENNSRYMDGVLLFMLPSHVWFGNFLNGSQDALNKIQKRMLLHYSSDDV